MYVVFFQVALFQRSHQAWQNALLTDNFDHFKCASSRHSSNRQNKTDIMEAWKTESSKCIADAVHVYIENRNQQQCPDSQRLFLIKPLFPFRSEDDQKRRTNCTQVEHN